MEFLLLEGANIWDVYEKYYTNKIDKDIYNILAHIDPTCKGDNKGKYLPWIINQFIKEQKNIIDFFGSIQGWINDGGSQEWEKELTWFNRYKDCFEVKEYLNNNTDINHLSISELGNLMDKFEGKVHTKQEMLASLKPVYNDSEWLIYTPETYEQERYLVWHMYGGASWCTASGENGRFNGREHFSDYTRNGHKLYVFVRKADKELFQFSPQSNEFHDRDNEQVDSSFELNADVINWFYESEDIDIKEALDSDWSEYVLWTPSGYEIGYFKDGTLYNMSREEIADGYDRYTEQVSNAAITLVRRDGYGRDIFEIIDNGTDIRPSFKKVTKISYPDYREDDTLIGIDEDMDFVLVNLDRFYELSVGRGIYYYQHLCFTIYLLYYEDNKHYGIANIDVDDMEIVYGVIDPDRIEIDTDEDIIYFWEYEKDYEKSATDGSNDVYTWVQKKIGFYDSEGSWEYVEEEPEDEEEIVDLEPSLSTESKEKQLILSEFMRITNKLNEIHKRNSEKLLE